MNPYQGLKQVGFLHEWQTIEVTMPMNPYQGLKHENTGRGWVYGNRHNANESLSGIET